MTLRDLGEERLLKRLLPRERRTRRVLAGAGDDCAVVEPPTGARVLLLKTDCVVEGVHFTAEAEPTAIGWKALARPLSDFAAMAATPEFALVTLLAPPGSEVARIEKIYRGMRRLAARFDVRIVGGETSATAGPLALSVAVTGFAKRKRWVSRRGGKVGDALFVTGKLGGSLGGRHLRFIPRIEEARWLAKQFQIHAMIDLSDGLGADLPRLAAASGVSFSLEEAQLPRHRGCTIEQALSDGEDYELLFAIAAHDAEKLREYWCRRFPNLPLTQVGRLNRKSKIENPKLPGGFVHFTQPG